ncbi:MAG: class I SAM-dependent methyltransferase [Methylococcales bacterium]
MLNLLNKLPPSIKAFLLQLSAVVIAFLCIRAAGLQPGLLSFALGCGLLATLFSYLTKLAGWWLIIQFLFLPGAVLLLSVNIAPHWFLGLFLIMLLVYWSTFRSQVPLYLSSRKVWQALEALLPAEKPGKSFSFIDLGCGLGGVLTHLAKIRPDGRYYGVELAPLPFLYSWLRIKLGAYQHCHVQRSSMWQCNLADYDVVFAYLSPAPMAELWHKARAEMRPGTLFISSTFAVPGQAARQTIQIDDLHHSTLLVWKM